MSKYFEFKKGREIEWLELNLLRSGEPISKSLIMGLADGYFEEEEIEKEVDGWIRELGFRNSLYSNSFYEVSRNKIIPLKSWDEIPEYYLCVYYSYFGAKDASIGTKLFEKISALALKNFIGGDVYTLGFPEGKGLNQYLDEFISYCFEIRGRMANGHYKDELTLLVLNCLVMVVLQIFTFFFNVLQVFIGEQKRKLNFLVGLSTYFGIPNV